MAILSSEEVVVLNRSQVRITDKDKEENPVGLARVYSVEEWERRRERLRYLL